MPGLKLFLLGSPRLEQDGQSVEMDTRKALALLAYLAVNGNRHTREGLAALLWPDHDDASARGAFRRTLSTLNKAVGANTLEINRENIGLAQAHTLWVDVVEFRRLLARCQAHPHAKQEVCQACLPLLQEAVALYQGDFMASFSLRDSANFDDWQFLQAEGLRQELSGALEKLARGLAALADYEAALRMARRWLALDPLREEAHRQVMQLYEWSGQHGAALRQYRECVRVLQQEIGAPPLDETTRLYQSIQAHHLPPPTALAEGATMAPASTEPPIASAMEPHPPAGPASESYLFVGRARELQMLWQAYESHGANGHFVAIQGEAGIGKTRLAQEFLARARAAGAAVITARCYEGEANLPYAPVSEALRTAVQTCLANPRGVSRLRQIPPPWLIEAVRLLPELAPEINSAISVPLLGDGTLADDRLGAQSRFLESLSQVFMALCQGSSPGVLFFDDLQWADNATLDWLTYVARRLVGKPLFVLAAWRDDSTEAEHGLERLMAETRRASTGGLISLKRLEREAVHELVRSALANRDRPASALADRIFQEAEGLPFFVTKYLEAALDVSSSQELAAEELPPSARDLLQARLGRAGETGGQLLTTAAVIGRSFTYDVLRAASGRSELEIVEGLDHLLQLHLIQEQRSQVSQAAVAYNFTHDKLRTLVYDETSLTRRRLLHQRTADAYAAQIRQRREAGALAAYHYQQAGLPAQAADYFKQAGDAARALYANRDAMAHYQNALNCGYAYPAELHEAMGDLHSLLAEYHAALTRYETAAALCAPARLPWIEHRLGLVHHQRGEWDLAECHYEAAAEALPPDQAPEEKARILADWSRTAYRRLNYIRAQELAQRALDLAESSNDCSALAQTHNMLGLLAGSHQDYPTAIHHLQFSLEAAGVWADPAGRAAALNNLARVYAEGGDRLQAITLTQEALDLCLRQGDRHRMAALHNNLADLYHTTGDAERAMEHLKQAVAAFAEIGLEAGDQKPEIWMLSEW